MPDLSTFIDRYLPEIADATRECRRRLQALFPRGFELVYDNYNALVFGFGPTERSSDAVLSIAAYPKWVTLFFLHGATLDDPQGRLEGSGSQVRSIRLSAPSDLDDRYVRGLVARAIEAERELFAAAPPLRTLVKSISAKQRPRRPPATPSVKRAQPLSGPGGAATPKSAAARGATAKPKLPRPSGGASKKR